LLSRSKQAGYSNAGFAELLEKYGCSRGSEITQKVFPEIWAEACDRLKAASLVGDWAGLSMKKPPMHEMEGLEAMIRAGWVPNEVLDALIDGGEELQAKIKNAFYNCFENGNKKSLPQENPKRGTVDVYVDDDDDLE
jgi:hypothetical protein